MCWRFEWSSVNVCGWYQWGQGSCSWPRGNSQHNLVWTWRQEAATAKLEVSAGDLLTLSPGDLSTLLSLYHTQASLHTCSETEHISMRTDTHTRMEWKKERKKKSACMIPAHRRQQSGVSWWDRDTLAFQQPGSLDRSGPHTLKHTKHTHAYTLVPAVDINTKLLLTQSQPNLTIAGNLVGEFALMRLPD